MGPRAKSALPQRRYAVDPAGQPDGARDQRLVLGSNEPLVLHAAERHVDGPAFEGAVGTLDQEEVKTPLH